MGKHRSKLQILANILDVVNYNNGAKKTQIMYQAYLSYKLLNRYLNVVLDAGLVKCGTNNFYNLTSKGEVFLEKYNKYNKSREIANQELNHVEDQRSNLEDMCF